MDNVFIESLAEHSTTIVPPSETARHLAALRLRDGEPVGVLNGKGLLATCTVERRERDDMILHIMSHSFEAAATPFVLCIGLLDNRDRMEFVVEKATELGVTDIMFIDADHHQHHGSVKMERMEAKARAALTQCGRLWLPVLHHPAPLPDIVGRMPSDAVAYAGDQFGTAITTEPTHSSECWIYVGPEGGFSRGEQDLLDASKVRRIRIGRYRLRAETAAIALTSVISAR